MIGLTNDSRMVITDSGGLQKEAFFLKKQCATIREETEWVELLNLKWNHLVTFNDPDAFVKTMKKYWSQISWQIKKDKKQINICLLIMLFT